MNKADLDRWAFWWSEARLIIAAVALFLGGVPPILYFLPSFMLGYTLLKLAWIISGAASIYLLYRWNEHKMHLFGAKDMKDTVAFLVMCVSGINLGLVGLGFGNIGMSIASGRGVFILAGGIYIVTAWYLYTRSQKHGGKLF